MAVVKNLMIRAGLEAGDMEKGAAKVKTTMQNMEKAVFAATKKLEKDFDGVNNELKTMFDDVNVNELTRELKSGGAAAELAARRIEIALNGVEDDTERARQGAAIFGREWKDATYKAEKGLSGVKGELKDVKKESEGMNLGALAGAAGIGGAGAMVDNAAAASGHMRAMLGLTKEEAKALDDVAKKVYASGAGESQRDAAEGTALLYQGLKLTGKELEKQTETAFALRDVYGADVPELVNAVAPMKINFKMDDQEAFDTVTKGFQMGLDRSGDFIDTLNEYPAAFTRIGFNSDRMLTSLAGGFEAGLKDTDKLADSINEFGLTVLEEDGKISKAFVDTGIFSESEMARLRGDFGKGGKAAEDSFDVILKAIMETEDPVKRNLLGVAAFGSMWEDTSGGVGKALYDTRDKTIEVTGATEKLGAEYDNFGAKAESLGRTLQVSVIGKLGGVGDAAMGAIDMVGNLGMGVLGLKGLGVDFGALYGRLAASTIPAFGLACLTAAGYAGTLGLAIYGAYEWAKKWAPVLADLRAQMDPNSNVYDNYLYGMSTEATPDISDRQLKEWGMETRDMRSQQDAYANETMGFATGGIVPGPIGAPQLAVVHGGEEVLTPAQRQGSAGTMNHTGTVTHVFKTNDGLTVAKIAEEYSRDSRRLPSRVSLIPI